MAVDVNFEESKVFDGSSFLSLETRSMFPVVCNVRAVSLTTSVRPGVNHYRTLVIMQRRLCFGGVQSANDCDHCDWMREELDWIEQFITLQRPLLGICLGAQLIARTLGARVRKAS